MFWLYPDLGRSGFCSCDGGSVFERLESLFKNMTVGEASFFFVAVFMVGFGGVEGACPIFAI